MGTEITLAALPAMQLSLPRHVVELAMAVSTVDHIGQPTRYHLASGFVMKPEIRAEAQALFLTSSQMLDPELPVGDVSAADAKTTLLTIMMLGLGRGQQQTELGSAAKYDLYDSATDDLPAWAIAAAIRRWTKRGCPASIEKEPHYSFPPSPGTLGAMAKLEMEAIQKNHDRLKKLLAVEELTTALDPTPRPKEFGIGPALRRM